MTDLTPTEGEAILVYLTSGFESFIELLDRFPRERFIIYGQGDAGQRDNLHFKAPSKDGFLRDLANSKAVMATAGFTFDDRIFGFAQTVSGVTYGRAV